MQKKLEAYKAFTYVAWTTVVLFSLFTYNIVLDLQETVKNLDTIASERVYIPNTTVSEG